MSDPASLYLSNDHSLPDAVRPLLAHGQQVRAAEAKARKMEEQARVDARAAILAANLKFGLVELGRLCPDLKPLLGHASIADNDDHARTGADFMGVDIRLAIPGFATIMVWVFRKKPAADVPFGPWEIGEFRVMLYGSNEPHTDLPRALAVAREEWLRTAPDADVPF